MRELKYLGGVAKNRKIIIKSESGIEEEIRLDKGGLRRRWANQPLNTFVEALEAFHTAMSFRFFNWLNENRDVFAAYKVSLGFVWA